MIIDFHTHVFPDKIAIQTIKNLAVKGSIPAHLNGTVSDLLQSMQNNFVKVCINLPVVTKPEQFDSINRFASSINQAYDEEDCKLISFAGIHPACENIAQKMRFISDSGFKGIKLHPDYQNTFFDDEGYYKILKEAKNYGLIVSVHAGVDGGFRNSPIKCPPQIAQKVIDRLGGYEKLVFAHMGGNELFNEVLKYLAGKNVYFDTGFCLNNYAASDDELVSIINAHGEDKILFATDSPWGDMQQNIARLNSLKISNQAKQKIFYQNAKTLLNI